MNRYTPTLSADPYSGTTYIEMDIEEDGDYINHNDYVELLKNFKRVIISRNEFEYTYYKVCGGDIKELYNFLIKYEYLLNGDNDDI